MKATLKTEEQEMVKSMLSLSVDALDERMKVLIRKWDSPAKAVQVLEVLDGCVNGALATEVVVEALQVLYMAACGRESLTHEDILKKATWRAA